jgi:endonuclease/exonuclease/phosphatase family metal-dependent hydrolase
VLRKSLAVAVTLTAAAAFAPAAEAKNVTVMTRNLFLGADLIPLATAPADQFQHQASQVFDSVTATDPNGRMKLVAGEIAKAKPDLVGLQEVSLWRTGAAPASNVVYDYTATIMKELGRRHAHYRLVTLKRGFNVEGPTDRGTDIRLTLGDAILARRGVKVSHVRSAVFKKQLTIATNGVGPVQATRGYNELDARIGKLRFHFVNTHLEAYSPDIRLAQAKELVAGPLKSKLKTVLVGDLNSGPDLASPADRPPYKAIAAAGFKPERTSKDSCCFGDSLNAGGWDHNVDWIMAKPKVKLVRSSLTGTETTAAGVHPSDHGGVVSTLRF